MNKPDFEQHAWTTKSLLETNFPDPVWIIDNIIPEGLTLLAAPVKIGKSWLALDIASTLATGGLILGDTPVEPGKVLALFLEDTPRRLKNRLAKQGRTPSEHCHIFTSWATGAEALEWVLLFLEKHMEVKLIIIDTLGRFASFRDSNDYGETTDFMAKIKRIADDFNIAIVMLHHVKKAFQDDFTHQVLGSTGIVGAVDTIITITRKRGEFDAILEITGRDVEEKKLAVKFDRSCCRWEIVGDASEVMDTRQRQEIIDLLKSSDKPLGPKEIADTLDRSADNIKALLYKMFKDQQVSKEGYGKYRAVYTDYSVYSCDEK